MVAGRPKKAGNRRMATRPALGTGAAQRDAAAAIHSATGSSDPAVPNRSGSRQGAPIQDSVPSNRTAAAVLAGAAAPQANVPHQVPKRARSSAGRRPAIG